MARKIRLSIRLKIIAVITALVVSSLGLYLFVALGLFQSDKSAYVFEASLNTAISVSSQAKTFLARILKDSLNIYNLLVDRDFEPAPEREPLRFVEVFPRSAPTNKGPSANIAALSKRYRQARDEDKPRLAASLGAALLAAGQSREALAILEPRLDDETEPGVAAPTDQIRVLKEPHLLALARARSEAKRFFEAREAWSIFIEVYPKSAQLEEAHFALAELLWNARDPVAAEKHYQKLVAKKGPRAVYAAYKLAWTMAAQTRFAAATAQFSRILSLKSGVPENLRTHIASDAEGFFAEGKLLAAAKRFYASLSAGSQHLERIATEIERLAEKGKEGATSRIEGKRLLRSLFYDDPDMVEFSVWERAKKASKAQRLVRLVNQAYLDESDLKESFLDRIDHEKPIDFDRVTPQKPLLLNSTVKDGMGLLTLVRQDPLSERYLVVRLKLDRFLAPFTGRRDFKTYLLGAGGDLYAHQDPAKLTTDVNMLQVPHVVSVIKSGMAEGVREHKDQGDGLIVAHSALGLLDLWVFAEIRTAKAFLAARELTVKSFYFGIFFISLAVFIGIIFARTLTRPLDRLFKGTQVIAAGDFKTRVQIDSKDEIGVLASSFNFMAGRIVALLEQEKDKVRMEEELKVAKLVQDSFFPATKLMAGNLDIAAFYTPSSECGGDWWGCLEESGKVVLLIGDATGHGVPAALITATAASCCTTVRELAVGRPELLASPSTFLRILNRAVYGAAQGKILMTFFVAVIDPESSSITYSNASHNPPYHYKRKEGKTPDKKDLKVLQDAVGLRLGHEPNAEYVDAVAPLATGDALVFFTDGFIECTNPDKEEFGNRRFIKAILKNAQSSPEELRDGILEAAMGHYSGHPLADDLTMVVARVMPFAGAEGLPPISAEATTVPPAVA